jgi:hypothetical protein
MIGFMGVSQGRRSNRYRDRVGALAYVAPRKMLANGADGRDGDAIAACQVFDFGSFGAFFAHLPHLCLSQLGPRLLFSYAMAVDCFFQNQALPRIFTTDPAVLAARAVAASGLTMYPVSVATKPPVVGSRDTTKLWIWLG